MSKRSPDPTPLEGESVSKVARLEVEADLEDDTQMPTAAELQGAGRVIERAVEAVVASFEKNVEPVWAESEKEGHSRHERRRYLRKDWNELPEVQRMDEVLSDYGWYDVFFIQRGIELIGEYAKPSVIVKETPEHILTSFTTFVGPKK